jgi:hypothetical protein
VVLSQRLPPLRDGDVVVAVARQRTGIRELPYFVAAKLVLAARPGATAPRANVRRIGSRAATFTDTNGFNCTPGPSAFRSPCRTEKAGLVEIKRSPRRPLFANLVMRSFPKRVQARASFPPARVEAGRLVVTRVELVLPLAVRPVAGREHQDLAPLPEARGAALEDRALNAGIAHEQRRHGQLAFQFGEGTDPQGSIVVHGRLQRSPVGESLLGAA